MDKNTFFDILIIGAGPAGTSCAISLVNSGLKVGIIDKASFPRDKICGDALSPDILKQLLWIDPELRNYVESHTKKYFCNSVLITAPSNEKTTISLTSKKTTATDYGYIIRRKEFDNLLFSWLKKKNKTEILENCEVRKIQKKENKIIVETNLGTFTTIMIVGADGINSLVKKALIGKTAIDKKYHAGAIRQYYKGVSGFEEGKIELHFIKNILPGYFWIFPMANGEANVGIGILSSKIAKNKINLRKTLEEIIENNPEFKNRFSNATALETMKGAGIALGGKKRSLSGDNFVLIGDAASITDPTSGEGVGNAIRSGRFAANQLLECFKKQNFSAEFTRNYEKALYKSIHKELKVSHFIQKFLLNSFVLNLIVRKLNKSQKFKSFVLSRIFDFNQSEYMMKAKLIFRFIF